MFFYTGSRLLTHAFDRSAPFFDLVRGQLGDFSKLRFDTVRRTEFCVFKTGKADVFTSKNSQNSRSRIIIKFWATADASAIELTFLLYNIFLPRGIQYSEFTSYNVSGTRMCT